MSTSLTTLMNDKKMLAKGLCALLALRYVVKFLTARADFPTMGSRVVPMNGKVAWVTGASGGIGEELVKQLVANGAYVVISARRAAELERVQKSCCDPSRVKCVVMDLADTEKLPEVTAEVLAFVRNEWKKAGIDILVNNAGRSQRGLVEEDLDDLVVERALMEVNFFGTVALTKTVLKEDMLQRQAGRIVNISSVAGKMAAPCSAVYSATKHALQGWSDTLRYELASQGVTVLNVCPGPIATNVSENAINAKGETLGPQENVNAGKMPVDECCKHIMAATCNVKITETWISPHPVLFFTYLVTYCPSIAVMLGKGAVQNRIDAYKGGRGLYGSSFMDSIKKIFAEKKN